MKIYAIRDRLIGYFLVPFIAPSDGEVMAGVSQEINRPDNKAAIAQSPQHFELHKLGEIDGEGNITAGKEFVCDCSALIRARWEPGEPETYATPGALLKSGKTVNGVGSNTDSIGKTVPKSASE